MVGPLRIGFGSTVPAGVVLREDAPDGGGILRPAPCGAEPGKRSSDTRRCDRLDHIVRNNVNYIGNLIALRSWYRVVRARFMKGDGYAGACWQGALRRLDEALEERLATTGKASFRLDYEATLPFFKDIMGWGDPVLRVTYWVEP